MQRVIMSSELIRRPSISKMQARIGGNVVAETSMSGNCFPALEPLLETHRLMTVPRLLLTLVYTWPWCQ
jgi:hypothetical protein